MCLILSMNREPTSGSVVDKNFGKCLTFPPKSLKLLTVAMWSVLWTKTIELTTEIPWHKASTYRQIE
jgi:hypothetical protein